MLCIVVEGRIVRVGRGIEIDGQRKIRIEGGDLHHMEGWQLQGHLYVRAPVSDGEIGRLIDSTEVFDSIGIKPIRLRV